METISSIDWKFIIGDIIVPIALFLLGLFTGGAIERRKNKAKAKIKGDYNTVIQGSKVEK